MGLGDSAVGPRRRVGLRTGGWPCGAGAGGCGVAEPGVRAVPGHGAVMGEEGWEAAGGLWGEDGGEGWGCRGALGG